MNADGLEVVEVVRLKEQPWDMSGVVRVGVAIRGGTGLEHAAEYELADKTLRGYCREHYLRDGKNIEFGNRAPRAGFPMQTTSIFYISARRPSIGDRGLIDW